MRHLAIIVTALALVASACAGGDDPEVDGSGLGEATQDDDGDGPDPEDDGPDPDDQGADTDGDGPEPDDEADGSGEDSASSDDAGSPGPDEAALEDPCADHADRDGEAFIALVAPVDDQEVDGELDLVGCSSVYEGTIQYRLLDGDGATLDEGFFTAECGGPCIGEFRETVSVDGMEGEPVVHVQVYWEDASDGSERDLEERIVVLS